MKNAFVTLVAVALLLTSRVSGAAQPAGEAEAPPSPQPATRTNPWQDDPRAKEFFSFGVRCGRGPGPGGLDLLRAIPAIEAHASESPTAGDLTPYEPPLGGTLIFLCVFGIAYSEAPDSQQVRARFPSVDEAYRLCHVLKEAPPDRQPMFVRAFRAGFGRGMEQGRQDA